MLSVAYHLYFKGDDSEASAMTANAIADGNYQRNKARNNALMLLLFKLTCHFDFPLDP